MMPSTAHPIIRLVDLKPSTASFREEVLEGLTHTPKRIPSKFFYDERGSLLFEEICTLPEYYPTRTEMGILEQNDEEIAACVGPKAMIIEFGSGSSTKTLLLLDHLQQPAVYMPIDISRELLLSSAEALASRYPTLEVLPVCADYSNDFDLPEPLFSYKRRVAFFPGSTIGNLEPKDAIIFLQRIANWCGKNGALILGVDRKKDPAILNRAYNDAQGVTAAFNLNLITRINRELSPEPPLEQFHHLAFYNEVEGRIEMHLVSEIGQSNCFGGTPVAFAAGEDVLTEYSYKYDLDGIRTLAERSGFTIRQHWQDANEYFSVLYLEVTP